MGTKRVNFFIFFHTINNKWLWPFLRLNNWNCKDDNHNNNVMKTWRRRTHRRKNKWKRRNVCWKRENDAYPKCRNNSGFLRNTQCSWHFPYLFSCFDKLVGRRQLWGWGSFFVCVCNAFFMKMKLMKKNLFCVLRWNAKTRRQRINLPEIRKGVRFFTLLKTSVSPMGTKWEWIFNGVVEKCQKLWIQHENKSEQRSWKNKNVKFLFSGLFAVTLMRALESLRAMREWEKVLRNKWIFLWIKCGVSGVGEIGKRKRRIFHLQLVFPDG
jgi:hypothetical protein